MLTDAEICPDQDVKRRMFGPIRSELLQIEERHLVDYGIAVAAGGSEESIYIPPIAWVSRIGSGGRSAMIDPAPGLDPGAAASPRRLSLSFKPEPVRTAFSTVLALPRSSRF